MAHAALADIMGTAAAHSSDNPELATKLYNWGLTHATSVAATVAATHRPDAQNRELTARLYTERTQDIRIAVLTNPNVPVEDYPLILANEERDDVYLTAGTASYLDGAPDRAARQTELVSHAPLDTAIRILLGMPAATEAANTRLSDEHGDLSNSTIERLEFALTCNEQLRLAAISAARHHDIRAACLRAARPGELARHHDTYWNDLVAGATHLSTSLEHATALWMYRDNPLGDLDTLIAAQHHDVDSAQLDELRSDLAAITDARSNEPARVAAAVENELHDNTCTQPWASTAFSRAIYNNDRIDSGTLTAYAANHPCEYNDTEHVTAALGAAGLTDDQLVTIAAAWGDAGILIHATERVAATLTYIASADVSAWQRIDALELITEIDAAAALDAAETLFTLGDLLDNVDGNPAVATPLAAALLERDDIDTISSAFTDNFCGTLNDLYTTIAAIDTPTEPTTRR